MKHKIEYKQQHICTLIFIIITGFFIYVGEAPIEWILISALLAVVSFYFASRPVALEIEINNSFVRLQIKSNEKILSSTELNRSEILSFRPIVYYRKGRIETLRIEFQVLKEGKVEEVIFNTSEGLRQLDIEKYDEVRSFLNSNLVIKPQIIAQTNESEIENLFQINSRKSLCYPFMFIWAAFSLFLVYGGFIIFDHRHWFGAIVLGLFGSYSSYLSIKGIFPFLKNIKSQQSIKAYMKDDGFYLALFIDGNPTKTLAIDMLFSVELSSNSDDGKTSYTIGYIDILDNNYKEKNLDTDDAIGVFSEKNYDSLSYLLNRIRDYI